MNGRLILVAQSCDYNQCLQGFCQVFVQSCYLQMNSDDSSSFVAIGNIFWELVLVASVMNLWDHQAALSIPTGNTSLCFGVLLSTTSNIGIWVGVTTYISKTTRPCYALVLFANVMAIFVSL